MSESILGRAKWALVCLQVPFRIAYARFLGVRFGKKVKLVGPVRFKRACGASIVIDDSVSVYGHPTANEVIGRRGATFWSMVPKAVIHLHRNVGCSSVCICAAREIQVGEGTIIGADAMIFDNDFHSPLPNWRWANGSAETAKPVIIGRGCFIGTRAIILKGVTIGDGAVVGAGAVVTCDVPSEHLAFGNPARIKPLSEHWKH